MKTILSAVLCLVSIAAPAQIRVGVTVGAKTLDVRDNANKVIASYPISPTLPKHPTPTGNFTIGKIVWNPRGSQKNPIKVVKIFFKEPDYYIHGKPNERLLGDAASHGCIRMASAHAYALARLLMENAGAKQSEAWYQDVISGKRSVTVTLPKPIPIRITK